MQVVDAGFVDVRGQAVAELEPAGDDDVEEVPRDPAVVPLQIRPSASNSAGRARRCRAAENRVQPRPWVSRCPELKIGYGNTHQSPGSP